jgi:molybdenum-dependent DNA-binding transcriptional regulator ModE
MMSGGKDRGAMSEKLNVQVQQMIAEYEKLEAQGLDQARAAIDEMARLWKESLAAQATLGSQIRKLFLPRV